MNYIKWEKIYNSYKEVQNNKELPDWFKEYLKHVGKRYKTITGKEFTLIGMSVTNEDYYFVAQDDKGHKSFESCVGKIFEI